MKTKTKIRTGVAMTPFVIAILFSSLTVVAQQPGGMETLAEGTNFNYGNGPEDLKTISQGATTVSLNAASGGAIWSWKRGDYEFVNRHDNGRLFQVSQFSELSGHTQESLPTSMYNPPAKILYNPTQAGMGGDVGSGPWVGSVSPAINYGSNWATTIVCPLEFFPGDFNTDPLRTLPSQMLPKQYNNLLLGGTILVEDFQWSTASHGSYPSSSVYGTFVNPGELSISLYDWTHLRLTLAQSFYLRNTFSRVESQIFPVSTPTYTNWTEITTSAYQSVNPFGAVAAVVFSDVNGMSFGVITIHSTVLQFGITDSPSLSASPTDLETAVLQVYRVGTIPAGASTLYCQVVTGDRAVVKETLQKIAQVWNGVP